MEEGAIFHSPVIPVPADHKISKVSVETCAPGSENFVFIFFHHTRHLLYCNTHPKYDSPEMEIQGLEFPIRPG
jgi:hypothetical protein